MKKLIAILLASMMLLTMVACDMGGGPDPSNTDDPGTSQTGGNNNGGENDNGGENTNGGEGDNGGGTSFTGYEWPVTDYLTEGMRWTGDGIVVKRNETSDTYSDRNVAYKRYTIYVETATFEELGEYLTALKNEGFIYYSRYPGIDEPALEFDSTKMFKWDGEASDGRFIRITFYSDEVKRGGYDSDANREYTYSLEILAYDVSPMTEPNQYTGS